MANQSSQFEDILLPPVILAGLFSHSLVIIDRVNIEKEHISDPPPFSKQAANFDLLPKEKKEESNVYLPIAEQSSPLITLGDFRKNILVLVKDNTSVHLADAELELLGKMLQALKLSIAEIAILNIAKQACQWEKIHKQLPPKQVLLFGVDPADIQIPVRFPHFRVQDWNDISFLFSPALVEINKTSENQVHYKKELWKALQQIFS